MADQPLFPRRAADQIRTALTRAPIVLLTGARQTGKTTLATSLAADRPDTEFATLDDAATLALARRDPVGFLDGLGSGAVIDEAQRAPELLRAVAGSAHRDPRPGRLLLTASASPLAMAGLSEWPPGLVETVRLLPLSQGEIRNIPERFIDTIFAGDPVGITGGSRDETIAAALVGGYPRVQSLGFERQAAWFRSYVSTVLDRDVRDLAQVGGLAPMPQLLTLLAGRSGGPVNAAGLARDLGVPNTSLRRYLALLEAAYLAVRVPAWTGQVGRRLVKAPRLFLGDTGLMAHLALITEERLAHDPALAAPLLETFAVLELLKQGEWSRTRPRVSHFRSEAGHEVDLVLQGAEGGIVGVHVRSALSVGAADLRGLSALRDLTGRRFWRGVLLYLGREAVRLDDRLWAVPLSGLWSTAAGPSRG
jgi:predicted AAA+ superfamily ATPase